MSSILETPGTAEETIFESPVEQKPAKGNQKWIILTVVAVVIATISIAVGVLWNNSVKEQWLLAEHKTYSKQKERFDALLGSGAELQKAIQEKPFKNQIEIGMSADSATQDDFVFTIVKNVLSNSKIIIDYQSDPKNSKNFIDLAYELRGNAFLDAQFYQSQEETGMHIPLLLNSYYYLKNDQWGNLMRKFDSSYVGPEEISNVQSSMELQAQMLDLSARTQKIVVGQIPETAFSSVRNGSDRTITMQMSEEDVRGMVRNIIDAIRNDQEYMQVLVSFVENAGGMQGLTVADGASATQTEETILSGLEEMYQEIDNLQMPEGVTMDMVIRNGLIAERTVTFTAGEAEFAGNFSINSKHNFDGANPSSNWTLENQIGTDRYVVVGEWGTEKQSGLLKDDISVNFQNIYEDEIYADYTFTLENLIETKDKNNQEIVSNFAFIPGGVGYYATIKEVSGSLKQTIDQNLRQNYSKTDSVFDIDVTFVDDYAGEQVVNVGLQMKSDVQFTDQLDFPDFATNQAVDISGMSAEEIGNLLLEIEGKFTNFIEQNFELGLFFY